MVWVKLYHRIESQRLLKQDPPDYEPVKFYLRFQVKNLDKIYHQCQKNKAKVLKGPIIQPYGKKELYILDLESNLVQFFQEI